MSAPFDASPYLMNLKGKQYLPVAARVAWFRTEHPDWGILTEEVFADDKQAKYRTTILNTEGKVIATATKCEDRVGFPDFVEKAETGSVGRALALCGYGTLQCLELEEGERLADGPIERPQAPTRPAQPFQQAGGRGVLHNGPTAPPASVRASVAQMQRIRQLQGGKPAPEGLSMKAASDLIERLQAGQAPTVDVFVDEKEGS